MRQQMSGALVAMAIAAAACGGTSPSDSSIDPAPGAPSPSDTTAPDTAPPLTLGEPINPLDDRSTITQNDSGKLFSTTVGSRIQLQLSGDWMWSQPIINRPHQLIAINFVTDPGYSAWDILIAEPGDVLIEAKGVGFCDDCDDMDFTVTIMARSK